MTSEDKVQEEKDDKGDWCKMLGVPHIIDINIVHTYSCIREKLLCLTFDALEIQLTGSLKVCESFSCSKAKFYAVRKKTYIWATNLGENILCTGLVCSQKV